MTIFKKVNRDINVNIKKKEPFSILTFIMKTISVILRTGNEDAYTVLVSFSTLEADLQQ